MSKQQVERVNLSLWESVSGHQLAGAEVQKVLAQLVVPKMSVVRVTVEVLPAKAREG